MGHFLELKMMLLILFIALAAAFYPRLDGSMSGSDFFLGGEDIIGLSGGAKNFGLVVATRTDWSFDGTSTVTADTTAYYVAPSTAGSSKASTTVYLNNNTFVTTNDKDGSVVSGFFKQNKFTGEMVGVLLFLSSTSFTKNTLGHDRNPC